MRQPLAAALTVLLVAAGCAGGEDITGERRTVGAVTVTFVVEPSAVEVGQSVQLRIRLVNNAGSDEELVFRTGQQYDFWVTVEGSELWRWSDEMVFTQALTELTIPPQTAETFAQSWVAEEAGTFVGHGVVLAEGYEHEMTGELVVG